MAKNWESIFTVKQKKQLIMDGAEELEKLVDSSECKDILEDIEISRIRTSGDRHLQILYLTKKGIVEEQMCTGHGCVDMADDHYTEYCERYNKKRKVPKKYFNKKIEDYKLTQAQISKIHAELQ